MKEQQKDWKRNEMKQGSGTIQVGRQLRQSWNNDLCFENRSQKFIYIERVYIYVRVTVFILYYIRSDLLQ